MNSGDRMTIQFKGKDVVVTFVQPGVVQKSSSIFYIQDSVSKEWGYCFPARLENLRKKFNNDLSGYKNRSTKANERAEKKASSPKAVSTKAEAEIAVGDDVNLDVSSEQHDEVEA